MADRGLPADADDWGRPGSSCCAAPGCGPAPTRATSPCTTRWPRSWRSGSSRCTTRTARGERALAPGPGHLRPAHRAAGRGGRRRARPHRRRAGVVGGRGRGAGGRGLRGRRPEARARPAADRPAALRDPRRLLRRHRPVPRAVPPRRPSGGTRCSWSSSPTRWRSSSRAPARPSCRTRSSTSRSSSTGAGCGRRPRTATSPSPCRSPASSSATSSPRLLWSCCRACPTTRRSTPSCATGWRSSGATPACASRNRWTRLGGTSSTP